MFYMLKKKKYILFIFHNRTQIVKNVKKVIFLMIPNGEAWHYLAVRKPLALLRGITPKHHDDFYCLN